MFDFSQLQLQLRGWRLSCSITLLPLCLLNDWMAQEGPFLRSPSLPVVHGFFFFSFFLVLVLFFPRYFLFWFSLHVWFHRTLTDCLSHFLWFFIFVCVTFFVSVSPSHSLISIFFRYTFSSPLQVVLGFVCEADYKLVAKAIRDRATAIKRQREKQRRLAEAAQRHRQEGVIEEEPEPPPETEPLATSTAPATVILPIAPAPRSPLSTSSSSSQQSSDTPSPSTTTSAPVPSYTPPTLTISGPLPSPTPSPANGSIDSGINASFTTEPDEQEADQQSHYIVRHASYSSATCE